MDVERIGFHFTPSDEELFQILAMELRGEYEVGAVIEADPYEKEPWLVFDKNEPTTFYVFTSLKKKSRSRMERKVGCGTWKMERSAEVVDWEENVIGFKKMLTFEEKKKNTENGRWIMHEYSLRDFDDYVLCKIRNKSIDKLQQPTKIKLAYHQQDNSNNTYKRKLSADTEDHNQNKIQCINSSFVMSTTGDVRIVEEMIITAPLAAGDINPFTAAALLATEYNNRELVEEMTVVEPLASEDINSLATVAPLTTEYNDREVVEEMTITAPLVARDINPLATAIPLAAEYNDGEIAEEMTVAAPLQDEVEQNDNL
ncbi:NAC domain-containing protein 55-like, partial [Carica papaya]|uniref:NAC domain-containing protein 55-like n=1 Tax=Carica papaya TaxID=3649 RepID=UPI000B8CE7A3